MNKLIKYLFETLSAIALFGLLILMIAIVAGVINKLLDWLW